MSEKFWMEELTATAEETVCSTSQDVSDVLTFMLEISN